MHPKLGINYTIYICILKDQNLFSSIETHKMCDDELFIMFNKIHRKCYTTFICEKKTLVWLD